MAGDFSKKTQSVDRHLANLTSARFDHVDGAITTKQITSTGARLLRVILNTTGATLTLRSGSRVIGVISATATTGTYGYGVYCENGISFDAGGTLDATIVWQP